MSRFEGKISASGAAPLGLAELLASLESQPVQDARDWREAIACYLSASEGWRDASKRLGGAFASEGADARSDPDREP